MSRVSVISEFSLGGNKLRNYTDERRGKIYEETSYNDRVILSTFKDRAQLVELVKKALSTYLSSSEDSLRWQEGGYDVICCKPVHSIEVSDIRPGWRGHGFYWNGYSDAQLQQIVSCL